MGSGTGDGVAPDPTPAPSSNNTDFPDMGVGNLALRAITLGLFFILGVMGNTVLVATIAQSTRLRNSVLNLFIINMAIINLLDCGVNLTLILGATIKEKWDYGEFACHVNAFGLQLTSVCTIVGLCLMALDRMLAVMNQTKYSKRLNPCKTISLIVSSWLFAAALSFPLLLKLEEVPVGRYTARYLCALTKSASIVYICLVSVLGYLIPSLLAIGFFIVIIKLGVQEKIKEKRTSLPNTYVEGPDVRERQLWIEINISKYVGVLFVLWCLFQGPYLMLSTVEQYKNSKDLPNTSALNFFEYPWQVDLAFTWMKLCFPIFLPIVTFFWRKEMWQKLKKRILCHKSNLIVDATGPGSPDRRNGTDSVATTGSSVPVLFATDNGLHIETVAKTPDSDIVRELGVVTVEKAPKVNGTAVVTARKCDVYGSQDLLQVDEDTSDYDSSGEIDPFSNSNPVSVRTEYDRQHSNRSGNSGTGSDQAVVENEDAAPKASGTNSKERKKKKPRPKRPESIGDAETGAQDDHEHIKNGSEDDGQSKFNRSSFRDERTSHDSGRASMEGGSLGKKKKQQQQRKQDSLIRNANADSEQQGKKYVVEEETPVNDADRTFTIEDETRDRPEVTSSTVAKPFKKKKKKKKMPKDAMDGDIEMQIRPDETTPNETSSELPRRTPVPPPRLKPIQHKKQVDLTDLYSGSDSFGLSSEPESAPLASRKHLPKRQLSVQPQTVEFENQDESMPTSTLETTDTLFRPRCKSDSNMLAGNEDDKTGFLPHSLKTKEANPRPGAVKTQAFVTPAKEDKTSNPKREKHQRKSTSDSQTTLLGGSNTSTDLSDLSEMHQQHHHQQPQQQPHSPPIPLPRDPSSIGRPLPKPRRQKKRSDDVGLVSRAESQQELLTDSSPR